MCRHVAPVGHVTNDETLTPHGIALMVASERRDLIDWNPETVRVIYSEPDAGNCRAHCVTDQPLPAAIAAVRAQLTALELAPQAVYDVHEKLRENHSPFGRSAPQHAKRRGKVALFVGDEARYLWPSAVKAAVTLLKATGINPVLIGRGRSNGYLAQSLGFPETARDQAQSILDELDATGAQQLMVLSAGDSFTFGQLYEERLDIAWPTDVELVDLASYLSQQIESGGLRIKKSRSKKAIAYVDPTHAVRVPDRWDATRSLTAALVPSPLTELFWRRDRAHPVGNTALQFTRPDIAEQLTRARLADAVERGAERLVCEDPATLYHLNQYAEESGVEVQGLYEWLAEMMKG